VNDFESRAAVIVVGNAVVGDSVGTLDEVPWIITSSFGEQVHTTFELGSRDCFKGSRPLVGDVVGTVGRRVSTGVSLGDDEGDCESCTDGFAVSISSSIVGNVVSETLSVGEMVGEEIEQTSSN